MKDYTIQAPAKEELTSEGFTNRIKVVEGVTAEQLLDYGFTNYHEPYLYYCKMVGNDISFNLSIDKQTLEIINIDVLDEDFLQPDDYQMILMKNPKYKMAREVFDKVDNILSKLQNDGSITGYIRGV